MLAAPLSSGRSAGFARLIHRHTGTTPVPVGVPEHPALVIPKTALSWSDGADAP